MRPLKKILHIFSKTVLRAVLGVFLLFIGTLAALQLPEVQTYLAQKATAYLSEKLKYPIVIDKVSIRWWDVAVFKNLSISDLANRRMIQIEALTVDFDIPDLLSEQGIFIEDAKVDKAEVRLTVDEKTGDLNINEFINALDDFFSSPTPKKKKSAGTKFAIDHISLHHSLFQYADLRKDSIKNAFDYYHISIRELNGDAYRFFVYGDTVSLEAKDWTGTSENPEWKIKNLTVNFRQTDKSMAFEKLNLAVGKSVLRDSLVFNYERQRDMGDFVEKVRMAASLKNSKIYSKDLALFAPDLKNYDDEYRISGNFRGLVNKFRLRNFNFEMGKKTRLQGSLSMEGLPEIDGTLIKADLKPSLLVVEDIRQYVNHESYPNLRKFGEVKLEGKFQGFTNNFVANGNFQTALGNFQSNIELHLKENSAQSYYKGFLATQGFNLGQLTDQPETVGLIDMNGNIEGTGLAVSNADFILKAKVNRIGIIGYNYTNINVNGNLNRERFKGNIDIQDPNLTFSGNGEVNLAKNINFFDIRADLQKADLHALGFSNEPFTIKTKLNVTFEGLDPDKINGEATLTNAEIMYGKAGKSVVFDSLFVRSDRDTDEDSTFRAFDLGCDFLTAHVHGNFRYEQVFKDLSEISEEYLLSLKNDRKAIKKYYETKKKLPENHKKYKIDYTLKLTDINPLMALFLPGLEKVGKNSRLEGFFQTGKNTTFACTGSFDTLQYQDYRFYKSDFDLTLSKAYADERILGNINLKSANQDLGAALLTEKLGLELTWFEDRIDFDGRIQQKNSTNFTRLRGDVRFFQNRTEFKLKPEGTRFKVLDQIWKVDTNNLITVRGNNYKDIHFESVTLGNDYHSLSLQGDVSEDTTRFLNLTIKDFDLTSLSPVTGMKTEGLANGHAIVRNIYHQLKVQGAIDIEELVISNFLIGNVESKVDWNDELQRLTVNAAINRYEKQILTVFGTYDTKEKKNPLNISMVLDDTDLEILEPFTQGEVTNLSGKARGLLRLTGSFSEPVLKGTTTIKGGKFKYPYLNTSYTFNDKIYFYEDQISVKNLKLTDDNGNVATIKGGVFHNNFRDFVIQINAFMKNFKVLATTDKDNSMYYGTAIVTGDASITGTIDNLRITANARSNKGTHLSIPIGGASEIGQEDYIVFVSKKQPVTKQKKVRKISGLVLNLNLEVTPEAECEIIFDKQTGDIITGKGVGKIKMIVDTKGEFSMFGDYTIANGEYNFRLYDIVSKGFSVRPGGTITWNGDPYEAILNLQAIYRIRTSLYPILNTTAKDASLTRAYPVTVLLGLKGNLMSPKIELGIEILEQDYPRGGYFINVLNFLSNIKNDETELNRQVFSLLMLRRLQPENSFGGATGSVTNSISELISNELNHFASQINENLEINLNVAGTVDESKIGTLQVGTAYTTKNGRLRIERNGNFGDNPNQSAAQNIIGEWTVEYWVSQDGRWRIRMYNRNTQSTFTNVNSTSTTMAGFSLRHTASFNSIKEFLHRRREEKPKEEEKEEQEDESVREQ